MSSKVLKKPKNRSTRAGAARAWLNCRRILSVSERMQLSEGCGIERLPFINLLRRYRHVVTPVADRCCLFGALRYSFRGDKSVVDAELAAVLEGNMLADTARHPVREGLGRLRRANETDPDVAPLRSRPSS